MWKRVVNSEWLKITLSICWNKMRFLKIILFIYHLAFSYLAYQYLLKNNGDALQYWFVGKDHSQISWLDFLKPGTDIIKLFTFPLVKYLHLPFWSGFLLFGLISYFGFYKLVKLLWKLSAENNWLKALSVVLLFLPNLHFWTGIPGKEPIIFLLMVVLTGMVFNKKIFSWKFLLTLFAIALIRPHVAAVILVAVGVPVLIQGSFTLKKKLIFLGILAVVGIIFTIILKKVMMGRYDLLYNIGRYYRGHIKQLKLTDAYVPLDEYSLPYKLFTFYFRPLPFEKSGLYYTVFSWENFVWLLFSIGGLYVVVKIFCKIRKELFFTFSILLVFFMGLMYVYAYANYGLIARTKIIVAPVLMIFYVWIFSKLLHRGSSTL